MTGFSATVLAVVRSIPAGTVLSYGDVAAEAGRPGAARAVGSILRSASADDLPWWRVVNAAGRISSPSPNRQLGLLEAEGWRIDPASRKLHRDEAPSVEPPPRSRNSDGLR